MDLSPKEVLESLIALNEERWQSGERASFHTETFRHFHRTLAERLHEQKQVGLFVLRLDGRDVAAQYDYLYANKVWGFQAGWLPEFSDYDVGRLLLAKCMERYIERGLTEYDFLPGEADYKGSWTEECRTLVKLEAINPRSPRARLFTAMKAARTAARLPLKFLERVGLSLAS